MQTRSHCIASVTAALGGSVLTADGKPKTILLQSAWVTVNIGDIGHTLGTLRVIEEHLPQVSCGNGGKVSAATAPSHHCYRDAA